jgi:hypothetical protein
MTAKILIAYAGSEPTLEVAFALATELTRLGHVVHTRPAGNAFGARHFDAVVVGSAVQRWHWAPEAVSYLRQQAPDLVERPTFLFQTVETSPAHEAPVPWAVQRLAFEIGCAPPTSFPPAGDPDWQAVVQSWAGRIHATLAAGQEGGGGLAPTPPTPSPAAGAATAGRESAR